MNPKKESVPAVEEAGPTLMERIEEKRKILVGVGILAVIVIVGVVLFNSLGRQAAQDEWFRLYSARPPLGNTAELGQLADSGSAEFRAHALYQLANISVLSRDFAKASEALTRIEAECGDTLVARLPSPDRRTSLVQFLRQRVESDAAWAEKYGYDEDPKVDEERVALVETDHGAFWIGFYPEYAPKHVEAFIANAKKGAYNGTLFYHVTPTQLRFGGETTRDSDDFNDTTAHDTETYVEAEKGRYRLEHSRGQISSVSFDQGESVAKLTIALGRAPSLNKNQTIFAAVLKARGQGMTALDKLRNEAVTYARSDDPLHRAEKFVDLADHPVDPVRVQRISIWSNKAMEEGHTWDTSAVDAKAADEKPAEEAPAETETDPAKEEAPADEPKKEEAPAEETPTEK